jgi:hypothetical protein
VVFSPDREDSYRVQVFPGVVDALRLGDFELVSAEIEDLAARVLEARDALVSAASALAGSGSIGVAGGAR